VMSSVGPVSVGVSPHAAANSVTDASVAMRRFTRYSSVGMVGCRGSRHRRQRGVPVKTLPLGNIRSGN
jgi:hypothetical protein